MDAGAVTRALIAVAAVHQHALGRENAHDAIARGRAHARAAALLAEGTGAEVGRDGDTGAGRRAARNALGVVGIAGLAAPCRVRQIVAHEITLRLHGAGVAVAGLRGVGHRETDRARGASLRDVGRVVFRRIHREVRVVAAGAAHVGRVVPVLPDEGDAVQRILREIRFRAVLLVELRRALERIRLLPERIAGFRTRSRQSAGGGIAPGFAGHGALAANVQRLDRIDAAGVRNADAHAPLLLHARIRHRRLHAPVLDGQTCVLIQIRNERGRLDGLSRERDRRATENSAGRGLDRLAVGRHERGARAVVRLDAVDVRLHHALAGDLAVLDRLVRAGDRRFLDAERRRPRPASRGCREHRPPANYPVSNLFIAAPSPA